MRQFILKMRSENPCSSLDVFILQTLRALTPASNDERESDALRRAIEQAEVANEGAHKGLKAKSA